MSLYASIKPTDLDLVDVARHMHNELTRLWICDDTAHAYLTRKQVKELIAKLIHAIGDTPS